MIQCDLEDFNFIHMTSDCWTTPGQKFGCMYLTGHWIDSKFKLKHTLLELENLTEVHSGTNLEEYYYGMHEKLGLVWQNGHVTLDSGSNNETLYEAFERTQM
ncbi:hypothetical protein DD238_006937 [Peronospora effusa]|uniref:Uncharacterized protein n=1 Tax=Peronospora effusa TaxID=542832 RepID=A0A3M6VDU2_9STRA|nr:hypothetical protein DD238_006937 [Peronospora effusa]RQM12325.1 hypothetical protein DD237_007160 [Peronospora effusa]